MPKRSKSTKRQKSFKTLKARITKKSYRKFDVERISKILDILPRFTKFYKSLSPPEIMALKFYIGHGSHFQTEILALLPEDPIPKMLAFPFSKSTEELLKQNIVCSAGADILPSIYSFDIKELPNYIKSSYGARIKLLNILDTIFDNPKCPKTIGDEILFRGMDLRPSIKKLKIGDCYTFRNNISTSLDSKAADKFSSNDCIFVFIGVKDIPFIYMPSSRIFEDNYSNAMLNFEALEDLSELVLPRNLEFTVERIERKQINSTASYSSTAKTKTFAELQKLLKLGKPSDKLDIIDKNIYNTVTYYYCTFKAWHPRTPISFEEISKGVIFTLNPDALATWKTAEPVI